jgi:hypothetical protein
VGAGAVRRAADQPALGEQRVAPGLLDLAHPLGEATGRSDPLDPVAGRAGRDLLRDALVDELAVGHARVVAGEAGVVEPVRPVERRAERAPVALVQGDHLHVLPVGAREHSARDDQMALGAEPARRL